MADRQSSTTAPSLLELSDLGTTRRSILSAMVAAPIVGIPTVCHGGRSEWRSAFAEYQVANDAVLAYERNAYKPAYDNWQARLNAVPPVVVHYRDDAGTSHVMRSDDEWSIWRAEQVVAGKRAEPDHLAALCHDFRAKVKEREATRSTIRSNCGFDAVYERSLALDDASARAFKAAICAPARSLAELIEKIEFIEEHGVEDEPRSYEGIVADIRRLAAH